MNDRNAGSRIQNLRGSGIQRPGKRLSKRLALVAIVMAKISLQGVNAQTPASRSDSPAGVNLPATQAEMLKELTELRSAAREAQALRAEIQRMKQDLSLIRRDSNVQKTQIDVPAVPVPSVESDINPTLPFQPSAPALNYADGTPVPAVDLVGKQTDPVFEEHPIRANYKYNFGTGALGGGGYTSFTTDDDEFSLNITNQVTLDGTFFDRAHMPTVEQGFNVPFARNYIYGTVAKNWKYQVGTQGFLGQFNLLDVWMSYTFGDWLTIRAGKGLAPPLYEYYAFSPALEPVITNSPLFQFAAARPLGIMASGNLFNGRVQYWSGVNNTGTSFWYDFGGNVQYNGAVTITPFAGSDSIFKALGGGVGGAAGYDQYALVQGAIAFRNGAGGQNTNSSFISSSGIQFFNYNNNIISNGLETRLAPHIFWFGRFSVLAEMMNFSRMLSNGTNTGRSTQTGFYVNASYYLTGERDYPGNGFQAYSTTAPLKPFLPSKGQYGPGAWQIATQFSELNVGTADLARGFADPATSTSNMQQFMAGLNWWPNKYARLSFDYVWTGFNNAIEINGPQPISQFNTFWMRFAMFF